MTQSEASHPINKIFPLFWGNPLPLPVVEGKLVLKDST